MLVLIAGEEQLLSLSGYTVIIPSVCIGNVAQLTCDLLISTMKLRRIGIIVHRALIPMYGPSAFEHDDNPIAALEIYEDSEKKLVIVQIRSLFVPQYIQNFHEELLKHFSGCERIIILGGCYSYEKHTIESSDFGYLATDNFKSTYFGVDIIEDSLAWNKFNGEKIHGCGNGLRLYKELASMEVKAILLFKYVFEGDNTMDTYAMVKEMQILCKKYGLADLKLKPPISWKLLYGNDTTEIMY